MATFEGRENRIVKYKIVLHETEELQRVDGRITGLLSAGCILNENDFHAGMQPLLSM